MLLAIDVGNTHVVLGLYENEYLRGSWRLVSDSRRTVDEYAMSVLELLKSGGFAPKQIHRVVIACVVPQLSRVFTKVAHKYLHIEPLIISHETKTGLTIDLEEPERVGADRIVNAVAAAGLVGTPSLVIDLGTATTFDVVDEGAVYRGGVIAPGINLSAEALFSRAALLPSIELRSPDKVVGKNTQEAMLSGIVYGYTELVDGLIDRIKAEMGKDYLIVATGGLARIVAEHSRHVDIVMPELTLQGMKLIADLQEE